MKRGRVLTSKEVGSALYEWAQRNGRLPVDTNQETLVSWRYQRGGSVRLDVSRSVCDGCGSPAPCNRTIGRKCCPDCDCEDAKPLT